MTATNPAPAYVTTYAIILDPDAIDASPTDALLTLADAANATFANPRVMPADDPHDAYNVVVAFDATAADVARYVAYYDVPDDAIIAY